jgi:hypothetical protein
MTFTPSPKNPSSRSEPSPSSGTVLVGSVHTNNAPSPRTALLLNDTPASTSDVFILAGAALFAGSIVVAVLLAAIFQKLRPAILTEAKIVTPHFDTQGV